METVAGFAGGLLRELTFSPSSEDSELISVAQKEILSSFKFSE
ncbi:MAG: hypothetical protein UX09_C0017G0012 [Candidatus Uhrbacteria bacterium GW2011_GWE2_45_35]|uniref:Uncharacterized protein n=1 Tax=Candidatus Uhrbacteria bacterium GW2011_GWE2_45_35 TaxID=1618993 RepID=A0A0G1MJS9_9BACT|nr:MAG: hypothetical protein UX09_C0017G0012 [Candidatus Uhrbacteria bacterium GW2011_GWE2_45_35]